MTPEDPRALVQEGLNAQRAGDPRRAEALLTRAAEATPDDPAPLLHLARLCAATGRLPRAVNFAHRAATLRPDDMRIRRLLADLLMAVNRPEDAAAQFRVILQHHPNDAEAWTHLGATLVIAGDLAGAEHAYESATHAAPDNAEAASGLAMLRELDGRNEEAVAVLEPWLTRSPVDDRVAGAFAGPARRVGRAAEATKLLEEVIARPSLTGTRREMAHFALGDLYAAAERYDDAFDSYRKGHDARHAPWNADEFDALCARIASVYSDTFVRTMTRSSRTSSTPVFIVGMPRSGTSLTEQIIAAHPRAFPGGERREVREIMRLLASDTPSLPPYPDAGPALTTDLLDRGADHYLARTAEIAPGADRCTDKNPANQLRLGLIAQLFPGARIIHTRRHPLDTCLSIYTKRFAIGHEFADRLPDLARRYAAYHRLMEHWRRVGPLPMLEIDYENLVSDQEGVSRRMIEFIGLEWDDACLRFHESGRIVTTASFEQVRRPMYASSVGRWRDYEKHLAPLIEGLLAAGVPLPGIDHAGR